MRILLTVLGVTTSVARADSPWSEYSAGQPLRPATQLTEAACDLSVDLRGALADVQLQLRLTNPGPASLAAATQLELPPSAQLVDVTVKRGRGRPESARGVLEPITTTRLRADSALAPDPVYVHAIAPRDDRPRFRVVVQPMAAEQELSIGIRWTAIAELRDGAIRLVLPGRGDSAGARCRGVVSFKPGPGTTLESVRVDGVEAGARGTATFEHGAADTTLAGVLAFKRPEPVVWTQSSPLGNGFTAQAITIATPAIKSTSARRALLVIDGSRSMELVGRHNVQRLVTAIGGALPAGAEVEAIVFDRRPSRVLNAWQLATPERIAAIADVVGKRTAANGSDPEAALALAGTLVAGGRGNTMVILITDGVLGDTASDALVKALGGGPKDLDLHTLALAPGHMTVPDAATLRAAVEHYGGSHVEVPIADVDAAAASLDHWLRPAWLDLALTGVAAEQVPDQLRAGTGIVLTQVVRRPTRPTLTGHTDAKLSIKAQPAPASVLAHLALANDPPEGALPAETLATLRARHPSVDTLRSFLVLASGSTAATHRRSMIAAGGPVMRGVAVDDPRVALVPSATSPVQRGGSAIDRDTLQLLFRTHLQPAAFACYQRALATKPTLAGTAHFKLEIGRGELSRASVGGLGHAGFDACLLDAAYAITPPFPNPDYNIDDRSLVSYPLSFTVREQKPFVIAGDADSSSPLDIDAIHADPPTPPGARGPVKAGDTSTPLGNLRPSSP